MCARLPPPEYEVAPVSMWVEKTTRVGAGGGDDIAPIAFDLLELELDTDFFQIRGRKCPTAASSPWPMGCQSGFCEFY